MKVRLGTAELAKLVESGRRKRAPRGQLKGPILPGPRSHRPRRSSKYAGDGSTAARREHAHDLVAVTLADGERSAIRCAVPGCRTGEGGLLRHG